MLDEFIPKTQIIIDKSKCVVPSSPTSASQTPIPSQTVVEGNQQTCKALKDIRDQTNDGILGTECTVNRECDTLKCTNSFLGGSGSFQPKPCLDPPGIHVTIIVENETIYDKDISNTTRIPVGHIELIVHLTRVGNSLVMKVRLFD